MRTVVQLQSLFVRYVRRGRRMYRDFWYEFAATCRLLQYCHRLVTLTAAAQLLGTTGWIPNRVAYHLLVLRPRFVPPPATNGRVR